MPRNRPRRCPAWAQARLSPSTWFGFASSCRLALRCEPLERARFKACGPCRAQTMPTSWALRVRGMRAHVVTVCGRSARRCSARANAGRSCALAWEQHDSAHRKAISMQPAALCQGYHALTVCAHCRIRLQARALPFLRLLASAAGLPDAVGGKKFDAFPCVWSAGTRRGLRQVRQQRLRYAVWLHRRWKIDLTAPLGGC